MESMTVFKFNSADGAQKMLNLVMVFSSQELITMDDAAIVTWPQGNKRPKTKYLNDLTGAGALGGAFWGLLFGLLFFIPFFGMAVGAAMGALAGKFSDYGISKTFIKDVGEKVTEGTSALFLMTSDVVIDKVSEAVRQKGWEFEIISTSLSKEQEQQLRLDFGVE